MRAVVVKAGSQHQGSTCHLCNRKIKTGESILTQQFNLARGQYHVVRYHAKCMQRVVDRAPENETTEAFKKLREKVIAEVRRGIYT